MHTLSHLRKTTWMFLLYLTVMLPTASHAQLLLSDDFTDPVLSPAWTVQRGYASIVNGWVRVQGSTPGSRDSYIMAGVGSNWSDYRLTTKFHADGGGNNWYNSLINFRVQEQYGWQLGTFYTLYIFPPNSAIPPSDSIRLARMSNGGGYMIDPVYSAQGIMSAGDNTVEISVVGGNFDVKVNGVLAASFFDPNPIPTGGIALGAIWESVTRYDYARVEKIADTTAPTIALTSPTSTTYILNQLVTAVYSCSDSGSGVASCTGTVPSGNAIDTASIGTKTFTVTAQDNANNTATSSVTYTVTHGIRALYDQAKTSKAGSTIPIKLQLVDANGVNLSKTSTIITLVGINLSSTGASIPIKGAGNSNEGNNFRYADGEYTFNLKTTDLAPGTYLLTFKAGSDPISHTLQFQIR